MSHLYSSLRRAAALAAVAASLTGSAHAATITVNSSGDTIANDGNCTLREAVRAANTNAAVNLCAAGDADGDVVLVSTPMLISLTGGEILITDDVTIRGSGTARITIDAGGRSRIFDVNAPAGTGTVRRVQFLNLVLQNGNSGAGNSSAPDAGGAVNLKAGSQATFTNVNVTDSVCGINGGGIHGAGMTDIVITTDTGGASVIRNNEARGPESNRGGGGVWGAGTTTITGNVLIDANRATGAAGSGGGVFNLSGMLTIGEGVVISNNTANRAGGGIESADGTVALTGVVLRGNNGGTAPGNGGGFHGGGIVRATITGGTVASNRAVEGGGLWISTGGTMTVTGTAITGNTATGAEADQGGGGVYSDGGTTTLATTTITGNSATGAAGSGGGVLTKGPLTVTGGTISTNSSVRAGGGIEVVATPGVALNGPTVRGNTAGSAPGFGGGIHITGAGVVTATGGTYDANTAVEGGGFWKAAPGTLTISNATITANVATGAAADQGGGGVYSDGGSGLTITGGSIARNRATGAAGSGGGVFNNTGTISITGTAINANTANRAGGGIEDNAGTTTLANVTLDGNNAGAAPGNGGGLHISGAGTVTMTGGTVSNNTAVEGGGLWKSGAGTMSVSGTAISTNTATGAAADQGGGGVYNDGAGGMLTLTNATLVGNRASGTSGSGGGLLNNVGGSATVTGTTFRANAASRAGGGIEDNAGSGLDIVRATFTSNTTGSNPGNGGALHITGAGVVTVDSSLVDSNRAANQGGGLWNSGIGQLTVQRTMIHNNAAPTGGGLYQIAGAKGLTWLAESAVTANSATVAGGGIAADGATVVVRNTTVSGNTAASGGGLASGGGRFLVSNATIARNTASANGGGLFRAVSQRDSSLLSLDNTIVADNSAAMGPDAFGVVMSRGYNLFETTAGFQIQRDEAAGRDITGVDPRLQPLADNGGRTRTHAVAAGSPAIGAGMTSLVIDQRGFPRMQRSTIGAFEFGAMPVAGEDAPGEAAEFALALAGPNPFRSRTTLRLSTPAQEAVDVVLFDALGRRVQSLYAGTPGQGATVDIALDASALAPGLYLVRMTSASAATTLRVTVAR